MHKVNDTLIIDWHCYKKEKEMWLNVKHKEVDWLKISIECAHLKQAMSGWHGQSTLQ